MKTVQQIFFINLNKGMMTQNMDQVCTTIVIVAAVVLLCMGFSEMSKMRSTHHRIGGSTCGMKSNQTNSNTASAKKSFLENRTNKKDTTYMETSDEWPNAKVDCTHKELIQNGPVLEKNFSWEAGDDIDAQYDKAKVSYDKAKASANIRSVDVQTMARSTLGTKNLGTPGFMAAVRESTGKGAGEVKFADSCVDFLQSEAYSQARQEVKKSCNRM